MTENPLVSRLLDLSERMMRAVKTNRPYPVRLVAGQDDIGAILGAAADLEKKQCTIQSLEAENATLREDVAELRRVASEQADYIAELEDKLRASLNTEGEATGDPAIS